MAGVIPKCLALVLCDSVNRDARTGIPSITRAFDVFEVKSFPATTQPFTVWLQVADGNGRVAMNLVVERVPANKLDPDMIVPVRFSLTFRSPNEPLEHEAVFENGINLEWTGRYRLRLTANGTTIMQRYFTAQRVK